MSYFRTSPKYTLKIFRTLPELLFKAARLSFKLDAVAVPALLPPALALVFLYGNPLKRFREPENVYNQDIKQKGEWNGNRVGVGPSY